MLHARAATTSHFRECDISRFSELAELKICSYPGVSRPSLPLTPQCSETHGAVSVLSSKVTAPLRASALPIRVAPVSSEMDWSDMMVPWKIEFVPRVAELLTCQK